MVHEAMLRALDVEPQSTSIPPMLTHPDDPNEKKAASHIGSQIFVLLTTIKKFENAFRLFEQCSALEDDARLAGTNGLKRYTEVRDTLADWKFSACETSVIYIYHIRSVINSLIANLADCPDWAKNVDSKLLGQARDRLADKFPFIKELRDAVAHSADIRFRDADIWKHAADGNNISSVLADKTFIFDKNGKRAQFEIGQTSLAALMDIRDQVFSAFSGVEVSGFIRPDMRS